MRKMIDPTKIPKYENQLMIPPVYKPNIARDPITCEEVSYNYTVSLSEFKQQMLPKKYPKTTVWGYEGIIEDEYTCKEVYFGSSPGPTFETTKDIPVNVQWINNLSGNSLLAVDPTLHWANPNDMDTPLPPFNPFPPGYCLAQRPVPIVTHLHGAEVRSDSDGGPDTWFTLGEEIKGPQFSKSRYTYPNAQEASTLWYHDHTLGTTRLNVYSGLAGFYLIRDPENPVEKLLPKKPYDIPLAIQDRSFNSDGSLYYPSDGANPEVHPYWLRNFSGNTIVVNGRVWPNLNVERRQYRFRVLNGSGSRIYNLKLSKKQRSYPFIQIGSDGGLLPTPVRMKELLIAPGERADILIDFSKLAPDTKIIVTNDAPFPYPNGVDPDPETTGQIMQFTVLDSEPVPPVTLPSELNKIPIFIPDTPRKILTLNLITDDDDPPKPLEFLLDGQPFTNPISELPVVGSTVDWEIVNLTTGTHPIHVHLIQFQVVNRQKIDVSKYEEAWIALNGEPPLNHPTQPLAVEPYLIGGIIDPPPNEHGWKDTVKMFPGDVTRIRLRWAPQDADPCHVRPGVNLFPFDPSFGPGYVWHCHILEHEDNEMMRPLKVLSSGNRSANPQTCHEVMINGRTQLVPPALTDQPIHKTNQVFASIEGVCPESVIIKGYVRRTLSYTALTENGLAASHRIVDDLPFECFVKRTDANAQDRFEITGVALLACSNCHTENLAVDDLTDRPLAYCYVERDIVKICIRKWV